ncbi:ABC transporter permease [Dickeya lacustris]|uniref:Transport permease protein n=1 Tax=Dickeya lacustris TaxID=2259638 RepID=A0ABY8GB80_9GAMM|nr:ABC transporter permease [Dickeya lacustris]WFN57172.1 ABC transporter permease [Dickeya lacustris]
MLSRLYNHIGLIKTLTIRDISSRYKGSFLGVLWTLINPIMMLAVYTFVFSVVFKARWPGGTGSKIEFALLLFSGLIVYNIFSECVNKSPLLIVNNPNFVKKIIFPVEILPIVSVISSLFQALMSFIVWAGFYFLFSGAPPLTIILLPIILLPLIFITLGVSWFLAALGVYIRDISQITGLVTTALLFLSPIFYSTDSLPEQFQDLMKINPLTLIIEQVRDIMIWGKPVDILDFLMITVFSLIVLVFGYLFFNRTKKGFADVL